MKLKTLHINTQTTWRGGERQTLFLVEGLRQRGHEAILAARPGSPLAERGRVAGVEIFPIRPFHEGDPVAVWKLARLLRKHRPDVLHMHAPHAHMLGTLASTFAPPVCRVVSRRVEFSIYRRLALGLNLIKYKYGVDQYIAVSEAVRSVLVRDGIAADRVSVVRSGIDLNAFAEQDGREPRQIRRELDVPDDVPIISSIGSLEPLKGYDVLLLAATRVLRQRRVVFVLIGSGRAEASLRETALRLGIEGRVKFAGFQRDVLSFLRASDLYVQPSLKEGLGTSILDALCAGIPVIATDVGGIPEVVENRRHGLLVPPSSAEALANAIVTLLDNPELAAQLSAAGRARILDTFSVDRMVDRTIEVYAETLKTLQPVS